MAYSLMANNHARIFILIFTVGPVTQDLFFSCQPVHIQRCILTCILKLLGLSHITYSYFASLCLSKYVYWHCWACHTLSFPPCRSECMKMYININGPVTHCLFHYGQYHSRILILLFMVGPIIYYLFSPCQSVYVQRCILTSLGPSHMAFSPLLIRWRCILTLLRLSHIAYSPFARLCVSKDLHWHCRCILTLMGLSHMAYSLMANNHAWIFFIDIHRIFILLFMVGPVTHDLFFPCQPVHVQRCISTLLGLSHVTYPPLFSLFMSKDLKSCFWLLTIIW